MQVGLQTENVQIFFLFAGFGFCLFYQYLGKNKFFVFFVLFVTLNLSSAGFLTICQ